MTCPTCKNKISDPYELEGIEYCCPNCAYNGDEIKNINFIRNQMIDNIKLSSKLLFKDENKTN